MKQTVHLGSRAGGALLSTQDFKHLVKSAPLFAIDLVVLNEQNQILVGERNNAPAKGFWFVPGGRVFKNESLAGAFERISLDEVGRRFAYHEAKLLGLYDHFYDDSAFGHDISTHYINATHLIRLQHMSISELPRQQHQGYRWVNLSHIDQDNSVHHYSKVFLSALNDALSQVG